MCVMICFCAVKRVCTSLPAQSIEKVLRQSDINVCND